MMNQTQSHPIELPTELQSPRSKLVYLYLSACGGATLTELQRCLSMRKLTLYSVLRTLRERGFVGRNGDGYVPTYSAENEPV